MRYNKDQYWEEETKINDKKKENSEITKHTCDIYVAGKCQGRAAGGSGGRWQTVSGVPRP